MADTNYKFTSMPEIINTGKISYGNKVTDIAALKTNINGQEYYYLPADYLQKGIVSTGSSGWWPLTYYNPQFLSKDFQQELKNKGTYVDLSSVSKVDSQPTSKFVMPGTDTKTYNTYGEYLNAMGRSTKGFLVPVNDITKNAVENYKVVDVDASGNSPITGVVNSPDRGLGYAFADTKGHDLSFVDSNNTAWYWDKPQETTLQKYLKNLGPVPQIATAIFAPEFLPLVMAGQTAVMGGDVEDVLKSAAKGYALGQLNELGQGAGSTVNQAVDTALSSFGSAGDVIGNIAGQTAAGVISSGGKADLLSLLQSGALGETVSGLATEIPGYDQLSDAGKRAVNNAIAAELQGRDPTAALLGLAKAAGESVMATSTNVPTETEVQKQQEDLQAQLAANEEVAKPTDTGAVDTGAVDTGAVDTGAVDTSGYAVQDLGITPENLASFQDTLSENFQASQWQADDEGNYTLVGDDGSTITMHPDGTTSATEAPAGNLLDAIGAAETQPTQATPTGGQPTQTTATTDSGKQPTQVLPAAAKKQGYTQDQLTALGALIDQLGGQATPQEIQQATTGATGAGPYKPSKEASFLGGLEETPEYYKAIDPETLQLLNQLGIDPQELLARQEAEGGAEDMGEHGEEGADYLEASGRLEGYKTPAGVKRGLPAGTLGLAGSDVAKAYQKAMQDRAIDYTSPYKQPIDEYYQNYLKKLGPATEATLNEAWGPYVAGRGTQLAGSGAPVRRDPTSDVIAYVPTSSIGASKYYDTSGLSPQLIAMVGEDPSLLNDPDRLALVMSHELAHAAPQRSVEGPNLSRVASAAQQAGQTPLGSIGGGKTQAELFKDLAGARDYLSQQYGYKGVYDQRTNMPLEELLADVGGWSMQSGVDLTKDPYMQKNVLNTPEKMAVYNVMHPKRSVQFDPFYPPVGEVTAEDFLPYKPPKEWLFQQQLKKRLAGMFGQ